MKIRSIPDILSLSRIFLLPFLYYLLFMDLKAALLVSYILVGLTDYLDGKIARRLNQANDLGKTLDSVADLPFYLSSAFFIYYLFPDVIAANFKLLMIFFGILILSFIIFFIKCGKPIMLTIAQAIKESGAKTSKQAGISLIHEKAATPYPS